MHGRYLHALERSGRLDRSVESLPDDETMSERAACGSGLTSPELCVLMAYAKITIGGAILGSPLDESPYSQRFLHGYFPEAVRDRFAAAAARHPLRREILATVLANTTVDRAGISFAFRMSEETGAGTPDVVAAHLAARGVFDMEPFWARVETLDGLVDVEVQVDLLLDARLLVERGARWLLRNRALADRPRRDDRRAPARASGRSPSYYRNCSSVTPGTATSRRSSRSQRPGCRARVAATAAGLGPMGAALDIVEVARRCGHAIEAVAAVYLALGERLHLDRLRDRVRMRSRASTAGRRARAPRCATNSPPSAAGSPRTCSPARPERLPPSRSSSGLRATPSRSRATSR